jgi:hypothetical protein
MKLHGDFGIFANKTFGHKKTRGGRVTGTTAFYFYSPDHKMSGGGAGIMS